LSSTAKDKLIVALDLDSADQARSIINDLRDSVGMFKIGLQLFLAAGPAFVREMAGSGLRIFLDLKFHDIPQTVASAGTEAARLGVFMFNVHAAGGSEMMRRTVNAVKETAATEGLPETKVIAVTVLTSLDQAALSATGVYTAPAEQVLRMSRFAQDAGMHGVVASPLEAAAIRETAGASLLIVTPGVRPRATSHDDQARVMTPADAIEAGADYLVVGRPILRAADPVTAARAIVEEIETALNGNSEHKYAAIDR
jgi:orotidine-5'-phosphate decarboxylase